MRASPRPLRGPRQGYNLVVLMVLITIMNVMIAIALPTWSKVMQREREKELIFRGLQYAEAIRVFQLRQGRYPISLRELIQIEPRAIRQMWTDPLRDDARWGLVLAQTQRGQQVAGGSGPDGELRDDERRDEEGDPLEEIVPSEDVSLEFDFGAPSGVQAAGPIIGVRSLTEKDSTITFMGSNSIQDWEFTADLIALLPEGASLEVIPRLNSDYIGKAFPEGLEVQQGGMPGAGTNPSTAGGQGNDSRSRTSGGSNRDNR